MKKKPKTIKLGRNPIAAALKSAHLKPKIKPNKKVYKRKSKHAKDEAQS